MIRLHRHCGPIMNSLISVLIYEYYDLVRSQPLIRRSNAFEQLRKIHPFKRVHRRRRNTSSRLASKSLNNLRYERQQSTASYGYSGIFAFSSEWLSRACSKPTPIAQIHMANKLAIVICAHHKPWLMMSTPSSKSVYVQD